MAAADIPTWRSTIPAANCKEQCRPFTLRIPEILPDEIIDGHLARIYKINGLTRNTCPFYTWVISKLHKRDRKHSFTELEMEAVACEMSIEKTARLHTTLPFVQFVTPEEGTFPANTGYFGQRSDFMGPPSCSSGKFCPDCVDEDLDFWGFAYVRRMHQLPGVYWCTKHGSCLKRWQNYFFPPLTFPTYAAWSDYPSLAEVPILIRRYVEISTQLLSESVSIPVQQARSRLVHRMGELKLDCSQASLDHLFSRYPSTWLHQLSWHELCRKPRSACFPVESLLNPRLRPLPAEKYVLLLALLFDNSDTALGYLKMSLSENRNRNSEIAVGA